jgi:hypothetical protein
MNTNEIENLFYEYGETMKHIGKCETNEKVGMKEYNKLVADKEKIILKFNELMQIKPNKKLANALGIV